MGAEAASAADELYLVGFTDNRVDMQNLPQTGEVVRSEIGPAAIVMSDLDPSNALEAVSDTHDLLIAVSEQGTVLPVRFGTLIPRDEILSASSKHRELFDRFIGQCEVRIVASYDEEQVLDLIAPDISEDDARNDLDKGRRIAALLASQRSRDAAQLLASLRDQITLHQLDEAKSEWEAFRISLLADMKSLDAIEGVLRMLAEERLSHVRFEMTAPLPLYSFV